MTVPKTIEMQGGVALPRIGFGTYHLSEADAEARVATALDLGYRHVDTAEKYRNETGVGAAIRSRIAHGDLTRQDVFVTTKLWPGNPARGETSKTEAATIASLDASLARLGLDHVDLYLLHAPFHPEHRLEQWRGLVELQQQGKVRAIGVSNFSREHIEALVAAGLPMPVANQIEVHPWSQKPDLTSYLADHGIAVIAYSSLAPLSSWRAAAGQGSGKTEQMKFEGQDAPFRDMARKYGVSEAQVLLRWALQMGYAVIPKSAHEARMRSNMDLRSFTIDRADMVAMSQMDRGGGIAWSIGDPTHFP